jgi:hypothetical protein
MEYLNVSPISLISMAWLPLFEFIISFHLQSIFIELIPFPIKFVTGSLPLYFVTPSDTLQWVRIVYFSVFFCVYVCVLEVNQYQENFENIKSCLWICFYRKYDILFRNVEPDQINY